MMGPDTRMFVLILVHNHISVCAAVTVSISNCASCRLTVHSIFFFLLLS